MLQLKTDLHLGLIWKCNLYPNNVWPPADFKQSLHSVSRQICTRQSPVRPNIDQFIVVCTRARCAYQCFWNARRPRM